MMNPSVARTIYLRFFCQNIIEDRKYRGMKNIGIYRKYRTNGSHAIEWRFGVFKR